MPSSGGLQSEKIEFDCPKVQKRNIVVAGWQIPIEQGLQASFVG